MDASICQLKSTPIFLQVSNTAAVKIGSFGPRNVKNQQIWQKDGILRCGSVSKLQCGGNGKGNSVSEGGEKEEEEWAGIKKLNGKCKETVGIVELLECLEKEAIMGDDEGREPNDYNRRAQIFDKSSRVFQALKETNKGPDY